jgi:hypothetical protein
MLHIMFTDAGQFQLYEMLVYYGVDFIVEGKQLLQSLNDTAGGFRRLLNGDTVSVSAPLFSISQFFFLSFLHFPSYRRISFPLDPCPNALPNSFFLSLLPLFTLYNVNRTPCSRAPTPSPN